MTAAVDIDESELTKYGIGFGDDGFHPYDPTDRWWNESWFWDWYDADGSVAGHCRIGCIPNQNRVWLWLYLFRDGEWLAVEHPFLDFGLLRRPDLAFDQVGVSFSHKIVDPLRAGILRVAVAARIVSGPRSGRMVPVEVDLDVTAIGAPHSTGQGNEPGHMSDSYDARRFEQPIVLDGTITIGDDTRSFTGRGERDHSWGPRYWLLEWSFLVLNGDERRLQCVEVRFPGVPEPITIGYLQTESGSSELTQVDLRVERNSGLVDAAHGDCKVVAEDGTTFAFTYQEVSSHEMDLSHVLEPMPPRSIYRRTLIRATPHDGTEVLYGWLEDHTMPDGLASE